MLRQKTRTVLSEPSQFYAFFDEGRPLKDGHVPMESVLQVRRADLTPLQRNEAVAALRDAAARFAAHADALEAEGQAERPSSGSIARGRARSA
jgi:hypothetical protein